MTRDRRGRSPSPRPVSGTVGEFLERFGPRDLLPRVQGAWGRAVGETIAAVTRVVSEAEGAVEIECESAVWAEELSLMEARLRESLNAELGGQGPVQGLKFRPVGTDRGKVLRD